MIKLSIYLDFIDYVITFDFLQFYNHDISRQIDYSCIKKVATE